MGKMVVSSSKCKLEHPPFVDGYCYGVDNDRCDMCSEYIDFFPQKLFIAYDKDGLPLMVEATTVEIAKKLGEPQSTIRTRLGHKGKARVGNAGMSFDKVEGIGGLYDETDRDEA